MFLNQFYYNLNSWQTLLKYWLWNILDARVKHRLMMQCSESSSFSVNVQLIFNNLWLKERIYWNRMLVIFYIGPSLICTYVASSIYDKIKLGSHWHAHICSCSLSLIVCCTQTSKNVRSILTIDQLLLSTATHPQHIIIFGD